ncbi:MAG: DUF1501 domain-containing protein [Planctomycetes bacterium]|nr:DUF1501 domain-containing protein [Planctomycetota bacterium]
MTTQLVAPGFPLPSRRDWLATTAAGFGLVAFRALAGAAAGGASVRAPHFTPRATRVLFLCMDGGPSHVDSFDHKPELVRRAGAPIGRGRVPGGRLLPPAWEFRQRGDSGLWISELFPQIAAHADTLCLVNSMKTDVPNHPPAFLQMHTGMSNAVRPSLGAWVTYGLGSENDNLPGFVTISPPPANGGPANYGSAFLPARHQGTRIGGGRARVADARVSNLAHPFLGRSEQRRQLEFVQALNRRSLDGAADAAAVDGLIASHELAFRMQDALPEALDLARETEETQRLYGIGDDATEDFGRQCLMARRLLEAGVRFVEVCHGGWDQHRNLREDHAEHARAVDAPIAGLLTDLASRGLLADTLVIWGGEFGRTPYAQVEDGRDHNHLGFTTWFAGGGVKGGHAHGATDEFGLEAVVDPVPIHDWHATILHLLGLDHTRLTFTHAGREMRLTDTKGTVVTGILG